MPKFKYNDGDYIGPYNILMIKRTKKIQNNWYGIFECPFCGTHFEAMISHIASSHTKSCGCQKLLKQLYNKRNGKLTGIKPTNQKSNSGSIIWECKCDCGRTCFISANEFERTFSCGLCSTSKGICLIEEILKNNNINYIKEYSFNDCINPNTGRKLRFDFYLPNYNCCIEYDGIQHFQEDHFFSYDNFKIRQYRDSIKNQYCQKNNIKLIRIPYWTYDKINKENLLNLIWEESFNE